jgi:hypothetical protein
MFNMEWLHLGPISTGGTVFLIWFFGAIGGYCIGRAHAAWLHIDKLFDAVDVSVKKLNKGTK